MTLRELADEYMCDPRTVMACLIHNKSSSSLGKKTVPTRKDRQELLPLMVLELSSVYEEDEEELMEELENANAILEGADKDRDETGGKDETDVSRDQGGSMADGSGVRQNQEESLSGDADGSWSHADSSSDGSDASWGQTESERHMIQISMRPDSPKCSRKKPWPAFACMTPAWTRPWSHSRFPSIPWKNTWI